MSASPDEVQAAGQALVKKSLSHVASHCGSRMTLGYRLEDLVAIVVQGDGSVGVCVLTVKEALERAKQMATDPDGVAFDAVMRKTCAAQVAAPFVRVLAVTELGLSGAEVDLSSYLPSVSAGSS
jgi:hypothetical protein